MDVLFRQAVEQQRHGRLAEALNIYDGVLRANPNFAAAHYNRGVVLHMMGKLEDALRNYDNAVILRPNDHEAHYNRGIALKALGRLEEAARSYDQAIALKPDHMNAHNNRGNTAIAHLAGALGRRAWVALKYVPDWRWLLDRSDSPWYPTLRLFRQPKPDDWPSVFAAVEAQSAERIS
jgi:tetratricopeptide (TPR) repeat protein